ncbi:MAG: hypothetical protein FJ134_16875 [Deltaproteobacteria bacterium]|nr:hypothetical protein [Deltaproteobacteria bacterium]
MKITRLPNGEQAYIPAPKLDDYLLADTHPIGRLKAKFFQALGFSKANREELERQLLHIAQTSPVVSVTTSPHGEKFIIDGTLRTPPGTAARVRTIWIIDAGERRPRFVTAYPL